MLSTLQNISKNGYLYIYVSNESPQDVYFDDLSAKHFTGPLSQEQSYYPFGTEMHGISSKAFGKLASQYKFNGGIELEESIEMYTTFYRQYDQQLGRFNGVDILSEQNAIMSVYSFANNNPAMFNDPLGDMASSDNPNTVGDIIQQITNMLNFGFTKTDYMFDFGDNNALAWDFTTIGKDGEAGISFGFNIGGSGSSSVSDQTIEEIVRDYVKKGNYNAARDKIVASYDAFRGDPVFEWFEDKGLNSENRFSTDWRFGTITLSKFVFNKFANNTKEEDGLMLWNFDELVRSIFHEYVHFYQRNSWFGLRNLLGEDKRAEREVIAYSLMYSNQIANLRVDLPMSSDEAISFRMRSGFLWFASMNTSDRGFYAPQGIQMFITGFWKIRPW